MLEQINKIVEQQGTPFYFFDENPIHNSLTKFRKSFAEYHDDIQVSYAVKANSIPEILKIFKNRETRFDVISPGELELLDSISVNGENINYTSVTETETEFSLAIEKGVELFIIGSQNGLNNLKKALKSYDTEIDMLVRINPMLETEASISTSGEHSKFGVPLYGKGNDTAKILVSKAKSENSINFKGFHFHLGTQMLSPDQYGEACNSIMNFADENKIDFDIMDVGGGFPIKYIDEVPHLKEFAEKIGTCNKNNFNLILEPGRFLIADSGMLATSVKNIKKISGSKIIIVDAGYNLLHDVIIGQEYPIEVISDFKKKTEARIAGNLCDGMDWFERDGIRIPKVEIGDLILFKKVGAYSVDFNNRFCNMPIPPIFLRRKNGELECIREKNSWQ